MTLRYENRDRPVTMSSANPSANAASAGLTLLYLNESTATQNPCSAREAPELASTKGCQAGGAAVWIDGASAATPRSALRASRADEKRSRAFFSRQRWISTPFWCSTDRR